MKRVEMLTASAISVLAMVCFITLSVAGAASEEPPISRAFVEKLLTYQKPLPKEAPQLFDFSGSYSLTGATRTST